MSARHRARVCYAAASVVGLLVGCQDADGAPGVDSPSLDAGAQPSTAGDASREAGDPPIASGECIHPPARSACHDGMCLVPAGCFVMGTPRDARSAAAQSDVEVQVTLTRSFLIGQTEVTREEWMRQGLAEPTIDWRRTGSPEAGVPPAGYSTCLQPTCPVVWVSFEDAAAFANLRSEAEGLKPCYMLSDCVRSPGDNMRCRSVRIDAESPYACEGYRLPTESEWEYAARADTRTDYYAGNMETDPEAQAGCARDGVLDGIAWYCGNSGAPAGAEGGRPHPVAEKQPNGFGLYDMAGNAYEWTNDIFDPRGYGDGPLTDPVGGLGDPSDLTPDEHPVYGDATAIDGFPDYRVYRGGSFDLWPVLAASGWRAYMSAGVQHSGLRLVRTLETAASDGR